MKNLMRFPSIFALVAVIGLMAGCDIPSDDDPDGNGNGGNGGGGNTPSNTQNNAISVTVEYLSSQNNNL